MAATDTNRKPPDLKLWKAAADLNLIILENKMHKLYKVCLRKWILHSKQGLIGNLALFKVDPKILSVENGQVGAEQIVSNLYIVFLENMNA